MTTNGDLRDAPACSCCNGRKWIDLPVRFGPDDFDFIERPCPVCRPWPQGFPGCTAFGRWVTSPSAPGEPAVHYGFGSGPLVSEVAA